jgi:hypothetical protein
MFLSARSIQRFPFVAALITIMKIGFLISLANAQAQGKAETKGLRVTILLFSGRPDPTYFIEDTPSLDRVRKTLGMSKETKFEKSTVIPSILGYKGIAVENAGNVSGIPEHFAVHKGTIEVGTKEKKFLTDEGNALEQFLLDKAIERGIVEEKILRKMKRG